MDTYIGDQIIAVLYHVAVSLNDGGTFGDSFHPRRIEHREAPDSLLPQLSAEIERHITEYGVTEFVIGCSYAENAELRPTD